MSKTRVTPKLRFPEYRKTIGWAHVPLGTLATRNTLRNTAGLIDRVLTNSAERGVLDQRDYFDKDIATAGKTEAYFIVDHGDYVYNPRVSTTAPVGPISRNNLGKGVMSPLYTVFRFGDGNTDFYEHYFRSSCWHNYMRKVGSTGARHDRMSISVDDFLAMPVPTPEVAEQRKIADCLSSLDELIAAEGRKLESLRVYKNGLMQQLFPRAGESVPRLRFPEFRRAGEWETKTLSTFISTLDAGVSVLSGGRPATSKEVGILKTSCVTTGLFDPLENKVVLDSGQKARLKEPVKADTIIISRMNTVALVGANAYIDRDIDNLFLPDRLWAVKGNSCANMRFIAYVIGADRGRAALSTAARGSSGSMKNISMPDVLGLQITAPNLAEQHRIAACLSSLDEHIAAQSRRIESLKQHKKGLMQQLFPSAAEGEA